MKSVIVISSALFLLTLGAANAEPVGRGRMGIGMMHDEPVYYGASLTANPNVNLTVEQTTRIRDTDEKYAQEMKSIQAQLYSKGSALKSEWLQATPDRGKISALQCEVKKLRDQMQEKMASHRTDVLNILTPEQQSHMQDDRPGRGLYKQPGFGRKQGMEVK